MVVTVYCMHVTCTVSRMSCIIDFYEPFLFFFSLKRWLSSSWRSTWLYWTSTWHRNWRLFANDTTTNDSPSYKPWTPRKNNSFVTNTHTDDISFYTYYNNYYLLNVHYLCTKTFYTTEWRSNHNYCVHTFHELSCKSGQSTKKKKKKKLREWLRKRVQCHTYTGSVM